MQTHTAPSGGSGNAAPAGTTPGATTAAGPSKTDLTPYIEQLRKALGPKLGSEVDEADLRDEFQKYLDYGVPADQALRTILRHHGVAPATPRQAPMGLPAVRTTIDKLPASAPSVTVKARILSLNTKPVTVRGEAKEIVWGLLGDETGTVAYTSWRPLEGLQKGDVIQAEGAYTKAYNEAPQVNFGDRTKITKLDDAEVPRTASPTTFRDTAIGELREGLRGIRVTGRVLEVAARQVTVQGQPKTVWGGTLADATGKVEFSAWADPKLQAGDAVTIEGGYVRAYRGVPQYSFDADARITPATVPLPEASVLEVRPPMLVRELVARGGGSDITLVGTLLEVKDGSGLVLRCATPGCTRVLAGGMCRLHNKVDGVPDLRTKAILDDGTGAVSIIASRELTEQLLGKTLEKAKKEAQDAFRPDLIQEQLRERLVSRVFQVRGNALSDDFGLTFIAKHAKPFAEPNPGLAAAELLARVGGA